MGGKIVANSSEREAELALRLKRVLEDLDEIQGVFDWLGALFGQIKEGPVRTGELAEMGQYLADNWSSTVTSIRRTAEQGIAAEEEVRQAA